MPFTYESVTVVMRGGNVMGPRFLRLSLTPADQADPRLATILQLVREMMDEKLAAWQASGPASFGPIS